MPLSKKYLKSMFLRNKFSSALLCVLSSCTKCFSAKRRRSIVLFFYRTSLKNLLWFIIIFFYLLVVTPWIFTTLFKKILCTFSFITFERNKLLTNRSSFICARSCLKHGIKLKTVWKVILTQELNEYAIPYYCIFLYKN